MTRNYGLMCAATFVLVWASACDTTPVVDYDVPTIQKERESLSYDSQQGHVRCVAFSPDGQRLASGLSSGAVKVWATKSRELLAEFAAHDAWVTCIKFSHDGQQLITGSHDKTVKRWDVTTWEIIDVYDHDSSIECISFNLDSSLIAVGTKTRVDPVIGSVVIWDTQRGGMRHRLDDLEWINAVEFSPDGELLAVARRGGVTIQNVASGKIERNIRLSADLVHDVAFSSDGRMLASAAHNVKVWNLATRSGPLVLDGSKYITSVQFFENDAKLVSTGYGQDLFVWNVATGRVIGHASIDDFAFDITPDGRTVAETNFGEEFQTVDDNVKVEGSKTTRAYAQVKRKYTQLSLVRLKGVGQADNVNQSP